MRSINSWAVACALALAVTALPAAAQSTASGQSGAATGQSGMGGGQSGMGGQTGATGQTGTDQPGTAGQSGSQQVGRSSQGNLEKFVQKAAIDNMAEIQFSQLAQQKAQDPQVKQFADTMVQQHTQAQNQLQQAASAQGLTLPSSLDSRHQKIQDKLSNLSGAKFDQEYVKVMVKSHKSDAGLLKKEAGNQNASSAYGASGSAAGTSGTGTSAGTSGTAGESGTSGASGMSGATGTSGSASGSSATTGTAAESGTAGATGIAGHVTDVRTWAADTLPQVQQQLQMAQDLQKRLKDEGKTSKNDNSGSSK